jgi:hypothetical protein
MSKWEEIKKRAKENNKHEIILYTLKKGAKEFDKAIIRKINNTKL